MAVSRLTFTLAATITATLEEKGLRTGIAEEFRLNVLEVCYVPECSSFATVRNYPWASMTMPYNR